MIPERVQLLRRNFRALQRSQVLIGGAAGALAVCAQHLIPFTGAFEWSAGMRLSLMPAVIMMAEIFAAWAASWPAVAILTIASLLWKAQALPALLLAAVAVICG